MYFLNNSGFTTNATVVDGTTVTFSKSYYKTIRFEWEVVDNEGSITVTYTTKFGASIRHKKNTLLKDDSYEERELDFFNVCLRRVVNDFERVQYAF